MSYLYKVNRGDSGFYKLLSFFFIDLKMFHAGLDIRHLFLISETKSLKIKVECSKSAGKAVILTIMVMRLNEKYDIIFT